MSEPVKRSRGRPPKKAKTASSAESTPMKSEPETPSTEQSTDRPGRKRAVPAKYREDFVIDKVINIVPETKEEEEGESDQDIDEKGTSVTNTSTPVNSNGKRKRGRPVGWRKFPEGKPETPPRSRGRPVGSLGKKKRQAMVHRDEKPQYYYLDDEDEQSKKKDLLEKEDEENQEDFNDISPDEITPPSKRMKQCTPVYDQEENYEGTVVIQNAVPISSPKVVSSSPNAVSSSPNAVSVSPNAESSSPNSVPTSPQATINITPTATAGKRRLFVKTKDGKFLRLPDNADSLKLLSSTKLVLPSKPVPVGNPPVQLSLMGAHQVPETSLQMKKVSFSNVHRIDDLLKATPIHVGKNVPTKKPSDFQKSRSSTAKSQFSTAKSQFKTVSRPHDKTKVSQAVKKVGRTGVVHHAFEDSKEHSEIDDDEEMELAVSEDEIELSVDDRPDAATLLRSLGEGKSHPLDILTAMEEKGWNYEANEPLAVKELLLYSLLHCQGALLNYTPEKRSNDLSTIERVYNAMTLLDIPMPGDLEGLMDYLCSMDDLTEESVGKIGTQRRWKYFFREVQQTVHLASSLLSKLLVQHWTKPQTLRLMSILKGIRAKSDCRLKATPVPSGRLGGAGLQYVLGLMETRLQKVLQRWDVRYLTDPEMICLNRTMYSTAGSQLQVITPTLCILPSMLCEIRINNRVVDFLHMGFTSFPGPLDHVDEIKSLLEQISQGYVCTGFQKIGVKNRALSDNTRGDKIYRDHTKTGKPLARVVGERINARNCSILCVYKPNRFAQSACGACLEAQMKLSAANVNKMKGRHPATCPDTGRPIVDVLKEERDLNTKLTRQVTRLKAGIAKFCMPGPYVEPAAPTIGVDQVFSGEVDSEEVVMATTSVQQQQQQQGVEMSQMEVPLEHALMLIN